jgi:Xaa-Pro aminopeptidase
MFYLSRFLAGDRFAILLQEKTAILVSSMEKGRAKKESCADEVVSTQDYHITERLKSSGRLELAYSEVLKDFLRDHDIMRLGVAYSFPAGIFQHLSSHFDLQILESPARRARAKKSPREIEMITSVQRACERAMRRAADLIASSEPQADILIRQGQPLTAEQVRSAIDISLLEDGCEAAESIVAGGMQAVDPHARGTGPLPANSPIVIDIFPRSKSHRYHADMTRTFLRGEAPQEARELYDAVLAAQEAGIRAIRAGASGEEIHLAVSAVFLDMGYPERDGCGFTHSTGHGVGLDVHEPPSLGEGGEILEASQVVTVEPGLYYPDIGGVRLEDLVVVRSAGCDNLTRFGKDLVL